MANASPINNAQRSHISAPHPQLQLNTFASAPHCASAQNPVDLVYLSRKSLGDRLLEDQLLKLFCNQSGFYLDMLDAADSADERRSALCAVAGSARDLGAWKVAAEAELLKEYCETGCDISALRKAIDEANEYIVELLGIEQI